MFGYDLIFWAVLFLNISHNNDWRTLGMSYHILLRCLTVFYKITPNQKSTLFTGLTICWLYPLQRSKPCPQEYPAYDTKLHLMVKLYFWRSEECKAHLHCHDSQVHSDPKWKDLLWPSMGQIDLFKLIHTW